jgi:hypothetical protein
VPWTLYFPFATVDDRVTAREHLHVLRQDNAVYRIHQRLAEQGSPLVVEVEFRGGYDEQPLDPDIYERISPFRTPLPDRAAVVTMGRRSGRSETMMRAFEMTYGAIGRRAGMSTEGANEIIQQYLGSAGGRTQLAATLANPLRQRMDYQGISRRTFMVEQLPDGALPIYDRDLGVADIVTAHVGDIHDPEYFLLPDWVREGDWAQFHHPTDGTDIPEGHTGNRSEDGRIIEIKQVLRPEDPPGRDGPTYVRVQSWRSQGTEDILGRFFVAFWTPCEQPPDPRLLWERLLGEDEF